MFIRNMRTILENRVEADPERICIQLIAGSADQDPYLGYGSGSIGVKIAL
jgi:hypothetical protein